MSLYKRGETWCYDVKVGRRRERRAVGSDKAEAKRQEKEARARLILQVEGVKEAPLFRDFVMVPEKVDPAEHVLPTTYLDGYAKQHKRSWPRDLSMIRNHLLPFFGDMLMDRITVGDANAYIALRQREGAAPATVQLEINLLKAIYRYAMQLEYVDRSPVHRKKLATRPINNRRERYLSNDEFRRIYEQAAEHLKPILLVAVQTGMRKGELLSLTWEDLDFGQNRIHVRESKNGRSRKIPMSPEVRETLLVLQNLQWHPERVFARRDGRAVDCYKTAWYAALDRAKFKKGDVRFHDVRHTFATHAAQAGAPPEVLKELLGHSTLAMVLRYAHMTDDRMEKAVEGAAGRLSLDKITPLPYEIRDTSGTHMDSQRRVSSL